MDTVRVSSRGRLDVLMRAFGCVEIAGAKWCGKTWTALSRAQSVTKLDRKEEREAAEMDPALALVGEAPHLVGRVARGPGGLGRPRDATWTTAETSAACSSSPGRPALGKKKRERVRHSGAGRIARLTMRPMSLVESGEAHAAMSLKSLLEGGPLVACPLRDGHSRTSRVGCCRGGWPANLGFEDDVACETGTSVSASRA